MQIAKRILKKLEGIKLCDWTGKYGVWILWNVIIAANLAPWVVANNNISNKSEETQSIWKESAHTLNFTSIDDIISIDSECIIWKKVFSIYIHCPAMKTCVSFSKKERADLTDVCVKSSRRKIFMQKDLWKISARHDKRSKKDEKVAHPTVTSKMLLPTEEETAMSPKPFLATMTEVIRSGMEVPAARKVNPITCRRLFHSVSTRMATTVILGSQQSSSS